MSRTSRVVLMCVYLFMTEVKHTFHRIRDICVSFPGIFVSFYVRVIVLSLANFFEVGGDDTFL